MTDYMTDIWPGVVRRRYANGGKLIAAVPCDIEVLGELVHIEVGQSLTEDQALVFSGDVLRGWRQTDGPVDALVAIHQISAQIEAMG